MNYAISNGIIDMNAVRDCMIRDKRRHYLSMHKYQIFQGKDGRWKTTLPDKLKKNGRKLIAKTELKDLEDIIIDYYEQIEENNAIAVVGKHKLTEDITLEELYPIWLESRILEVNSINTVKRNDQDWKRYYEGTVITQIPMKNITINELKDWAHTLIEINNFNKRQYYNMSVIMKKCFEYVGDEGICDNTWSKVKINTKKLRKEYKKENYTQIYFKDEKVMLLKYALTKFKERPWNISILTIPLLFVTGMRIGEIAALKYSDLTENEIIIAREETNDYKYSKDGFVWNGKKVVEHTKTEAGIRAIPYTNSAKQIIGLIKKYSEHYGYYDNDYIFCNRSKKINSNSIDKLLYKYCDMVGIPKKSAHKIRKTYISQIAISGIDLDTVCRVAGHVDLKTTFQSYYFSLDKKEETYEKFENMFRDIV